MSLDLENIIGEVKGAKNPSDLNQLRIKYLGKAGIITTEARSIGTLPPADRAARGAEINQVRKAAEEAIVTQQRALDAAAIEADTAAITLDVTAPAPWKPLGSGHAHPVQNVIDDLVRVFWQMGYQIADGPEIETEWYNFEALNIPEDHPARDMQDTFYLEGGNLPRTHTSNVQIRYMENNKPPIRIVAPGKVYRNEDEDARHSWMFNQIEGLVVDEDVSLADLKGTLYAMMRGVLGKDTEIKLLPNFFPYTEPSVEMHATCPSCKGKGCGMCGQTGWLELGGAGMVHPKVLQNVGIDPARYSGFAFGFGPERIAAIRYDIHDVREFWRPNLKFLEQF